MTDAALKFSEMPYLRPDIEQLKSAMAALSSQLDEADSAEDYAAIVPPWQALQRTLSTASSLADVYYHQDTTDERAKVEKTFFDEHAPIFSELYVDLAQKLLDSPHRGALETQLGAQLFSVLEAEAASFEPKIARQMKQEARLGTEYTTLLASARIPFQGEELNFPSLDKFYSDADPQVRLAAQQARWGHVARQAETLDRIFHELVGLRDQMGRALGYESYIPLAYHKMTRTDYGPAEVARFREQVVRHVVPVATRLRAEQAQRLGLERLLFQDEAVQHLDGNPAPLGGVDWQVERAVEMYRSMHPELAEFFEMLVQRELMDLDNRPSKAGGGFCTAFPEHKVPFIYANFNGTQHDVRVLTHECGHAFQGYMSRDLPLLEYGWPTAEACEIHSMGLEYLCWPEMELFFGDQAQRFRRDHLIQALQFLPYGCAVDHFQHWVYEHPSATPADRHGAWQEMEQIYLPHRDYGGLPHVQDGGLWQMQRHIYKWPFYYIDYSLALTGALQFWKQSQSDRPAALTDYVALCRLGGSQPYLQLLASANLDSPFEEGTVEGVVQEAETWLAAN